MGMEVLSATRTEGQEQATATWSKTPVAGRANLYNLRPSDH